MWTFVNGAKIREHWRFFTNEIRYINLHVRFTYFSRYGWKDNVFNFHLNVFSDKSCCHAEQQMADCSTVTVSDFFDISINVILYFLRCTLATKINTSVYQLELEFRSLYDLVNTVNNVDLVDLGTGCTTDPPPNHWRSSFSCRSSKNVEQSAAGSDVITTIITIIL